MEVKIIRIKAKRAFTPTKLPGANYVLNQYVGCQHACKYCYAKFMCKWHAYGKWGSWVVVKENFPELVKGRRVAGRVYMSSVSDPYQPVEREILLTRKILEKMDKKTRLSILTKSDLVLRDIDLFKEFGDIEVGLTINDFDGRVKKEIEPFSPPKERRIRALKELSENGIKTYAFISPIIPELVDVEELINETKSFADFYWFEFLNLRASGREFREWLKENYAESYETLVRRTEFEKYVKSVRYAIKNSRVHVKGICIHYPELAKPLFPDVNNACRSASADVVR